MVAAVALTGVAGLVALVAPGIGQPAKEWLRTISLLRKAASTPVLETGRPAVMADFERLQLHLPAMVGLNTQVINGLIKDARFIEAEEGDVVVRYGDVSDAAYFIGF